MITDLIYRAYERRLGAALRDGGRLPHHVAVILDGNRRYARAQGLSTVSDGHRRGAGKIHELIDWCHELGIDYVTLWLLSTENLQRDAEEVGALVGIIARTVLDIAEHPSSVKVTGVGCFDDLPDDLRDAVKEAEERTRERSGLHVQVAVGYGGRREITDALRAWMEARWAQGATLPEVIAELSPEAISEHLYTSGTPDPDLIIRTSGEIRLSGFLLWQSVHSEFYFCDPNWPEFRKTDFLRALRDFQSRQRRYGR